MILPSVPRVYEKVHTAVQARFDEATGSSAGSSTGRSRSARVSRLEGEGKPIPAALRRHRLADRLVFSKVRERLGGRLRIPISGGAPLARGSPTSSTGSGSASSRA